jgi:hypothetical protein
MAAQQETGILVSLSHSETRNKTGEGWLILFLFITIFFLPLHSHLHDNPSQITNECSCLHGCRAATGLVPAVLDLTTELQCFAYDFVQPRLVLSRAVINLLSIRAPPIS